MSKITGKQKKSGGGSRIFFLPIGHHKRHKNRTNKYYSHSNYDSPTTPVMMSADSPTSIGKEFEFKDSNSMPPPTTSKDTSTQSNHVMSDQMNSKTGAVSALAEPLKEHGPNTNSVGILDVPPNQKSEAETDNREDSGLLEGEDHVCSAGARGGEDEKNVPPKMNGKGDQLDAKWVPPLDKKKEEETENEDCTVKCLYYTLQCCECNIM